MGRSVRIAVATLALSACAPRPNANRAVVHARFDPVARVIPMPSDVLRDAAAGHLDLPATDADLSDAERQLFGWMNGLDAWSSASQATLAFDGGIAPGSITPDTVQVYEWAGGASTRRHDRVPSLDPDGRMLRVDAPDTGWTRGGAFEVVVRGGPHGVRGSAGEPVECDAAFWFLRLTTPLTDPAHVNAFPGDTLAEKQANAQKLEKIRLQLAPFFDDLEARGIPRNDVAALWTFTVTTATELAMDKVSERVPMPSDLMFEPSTGRIDIPDRAPDTDLEREVKKTLRSYDGFGPTMTPSFELTAPVDPSTIGPETVALYRAGSPPEPIAGTIEVSPDHLRVRFTPDVPLLPKSLYVLAVRPGVLDADGRPITGMPASFLLRATAPISMDGRSTISALSDDDALRAESARTELAATLDALGRDQVDQAWPFRTMSVVEPLVAAQQAGETLGLDPDPASVTSKTPAGAVLDFPLPGLLLLNVSKVFYGTITTPDYLDPATRGRREDGSYEARAIDFTLTIPNGAAAGTPLPVVIFGHGLMTERRFVLAVADALAARGFAAISIDLPYHGKRSVCGWNGPACFPSPFSATGDMICPDPCQAGSSCSDDGQCRNGSGQVTPLSTWGPFPLYQASGSAFVDVDHMSHSRDHFFQAVTDLGSLSRSLREGDWQGATGYTFDGSALYYVGQSLGGILGATYTPLDGHVVRSVLNVPGANLIPMFKNSQIFGPDFDAFLARNSIEPDSAQADKFSNIAHWLMDSVDPANVARNLIVEPIPGVGIPPNRKVMIQMATLDFIIPNSATKFLQSVTGVPRVDYIAEHGFLAVPPEPAYLPGNHDCAAFLDGSFQP